MRAGNYFAPNSVAIIDEELAKRFWPNGDALGGGISWSREGPWATVVGICATAQLKDLAEESKGTFYLPSYFQAATLVVRTSVEPRMLTSSIRDQVLAVDPNQPVFDVKTMEERVAMTLETRRFAVVLLGIFGSLALMLAGIGLYGVLAFAVSHRTREIGIHLALGAQPRDVLVMVIKQGMLLVVLGALLGVGGSFCLDAPDADPVVRRQSTDPVTFVLVPLLLAESDSLPAISRRDEQQKSILWWPYATSREATIEDGRRRLEFRARRKEDVMLGTLKQNIVYGLRTLLKSPGFTLTSVLTLALGIGATTAIFSVVYTTLFEPMPYPKPDQLVVLWSKTAEGRTQVSTADFFDWKKQSNSFQYLEAWSGGLINISTSDRPQQVEGSIMTPGFNTMTGSKIFLGRRLSSRGW